MTITRNFKLYLNAGTASAPYINVNQYDEGEEWVFTLYNEDGSTYTPSTGAIIGIKSDGNAIMNSGSVVGGKVVITETQQMTAASGRAIYELLIDNATHGTANFIVNVERRPSDDAEFSDSDLSMLQEAIDAAEVINEILDEGGDPSEIITENVNNWLDNHPEATTTVQDGAITAPKINQSLWDKLLVSEEASGNPASFEDGADDVPVSSLKVALEPIQTGTGEPSPTNIRPIVASNGKNLLNVTGTTQTINGVTFTVNADGTIRATGTATSNRATFSLGSVNFKANTGYILNGCPSGGSNSTYNMNIAGAFSVDTGNGGAVYTPTADVTYAARIDIYPAAGNVDLVFKPMIRPASITDPSYQPYQGIMVERCGRNLYWTPTNRTVTISGVTFTYTAEGTVKVSGTASATVNLGILSAQSGFDQNIDTIKAGTYTISASGLNSNVVLIYGSGGNTAGITYTEFDSDNSKTFTCTDGTTGYNVIRVTSGATVNTEVKIHLEYGETAHEFEPYIGTSYPYTLGQSVYGGTVDLATGVLTVTHGIVTDFSALASNGTSSTGAYRYKLEVAGVAGYTVGEAKCNMLKFKVGFNDDAGEFYNGLNVFNIFLADSTVASAITTLTGCQIVYPLSTPQTIQLTPTEVKTLLGYNNISSSGTVDVIYHADTKLYVDKMTAVDNNIIAPTEATFTATRNYTVNDLVIVNDTLYKVTANIATGSAITPSSNVQQTTLGALIKALS